MLSRSLSRSPVRFLDCQVVLLDNSEFSTTFEAEEVQGKELLDLVCEKAEVPQNLRRYFGLQYVDQKDGEMTWLSLENPIRHPKKRGTARSFQLTVKVFPKNPVQFVEFSLSTARLFVFQLKHLIAQGKVQLPVEQHAVLDSYFAQAVLGDYNPQKHGYGYLEGLLGPTFYSHPSHINSNFDIKDSSYEKIVTEMHKSRKGMSTKESLMAFLDLCHTNKGYGKFFHKGATDSSNNQVIFSVSVRGLQICALDEFREPGEILHDFPWDVVHSILTDKGKFLLTIRPTESTTGAGIVYKFRFHGHFSFLQAERLETDCLYHQKLALDKASDERRAMRSQSLDNTLDSHSLSVPLNGLRNRSYSPMMSLKKQMRKDVEHYV